MTINFNEQWTNLPGGRVKFGLRSGELRLNLTRGTIPYEARNLTGNLDLAIRKERESHASVGGSREQQGSVGLSLKAEEAELQAAFSETSKNERSYSQVNKFTVTSCQVTTKGSLSQPAWVFEVKTEEPVLKGLLSKVELATMSLMGTDWKVAATFEVVTLKDIRLTETEGPLIRNASPEQRTALEIGLAKLLIKHKLKPYLSQMEIKA